MHLSEVGVASRQTESGWLVSSYAMSGFLLGRAECCLFLMQIRLLKKKTFKPPSMFSVF